MRAFIAIFTAFFIVFLILLNPFSIYFEAKYQKSFFLSDTKLDEFSVAALNFINQEFKRLKFLKDEEEVFKSAFKESVLDENLTADNSPLIKPKQDIDPVKIAAENNDTNLTNEPVKTVLKKDDLNSTQLKKINLEANSTVILVGDSIMSGFGWGLENLLKSRQVKVKNFAKASTGLLNKKFYDWRSELDKILEENDDNNTVLMAIFGANDAYSFNFGKKIAKFGTEEWANEYKKRIDEIYEIVKKYETGLVWLGLPCMQNEKFSEKMNALNKIYKEMANEKGVKFISLSDALCKDGKFLKTDDAKKSLRGEDGVHLSMHGSTQAAKYAIIEILK